MTDGFVVPSLRASDLRRLSAYTPSPARRSVKDIRDAADDAEEDVSPSNPRRSPKPSVMASPALHHMKRADVSLESFKEATKRRLSVGTPSSLPTQSRIKPSTPTATTSDSDDEGDGQLLVRKKLRLDTTGADDGMYGYGEEENDPPADHNRSSLKRDRPTSSPAKEKHVTASPAKEKAALSKPPTRLVKASQSRKKRRISVSQSPPKKRVLRERGKK